MTTLKETLKISLDTIFSLNVPEWKRYAECAKIIFSRIVLESCKYLGKMWNYFSFYNVTEGPLSNENMWGTYQQTYPIVIGGWLVRTVWLFPMIYCKMSANFQQQ